MANNFQALSKRSPSKKQQPQTAYMNAADIEWPAEGEFNQATIEEVPPEDMFQGLYDLETDADIAEILGEYMPKAKPRDGQTSAAQASKKPSRPSQRPERK